MDEKLATTQAIGGLIRCVRKQQGLSQTELAGFANVGITFVSQLENGKETAEIGKVITVLATLGIDLIGRRRG